MVNDMQGSKKRKSASNESVPRKQRNSPVQDKVRDDDIMYLNVGGKTMACCRSTLCQVEGSYLASMFSGRWESQLKKDKDGNIFLNFDPTYFDLILQFLRAKEISIPEYPPPTPKPTKNDLPRFYSLINYLGLTDAFKVCGDRFYDDHATYVSLSEGDRIARHKRTTDYEPSTDSVQNFVRGAKTCESGRTQWRIKVKAKDVSGMFTGVIEENGDGVSDRARPIWWDKGANGWYGNIVWQNGEHMKYDVSADIVSAGGTYVLTLDLDEMTLCLSNGKDVVSMKLKRVKNIKSGPHWWSLCVGFNGMQNEVQLLD